MSVDPNESTLSSLPALPEGLQNLRAERDEFRAKCIKLEGRANELWDLLQSGKGFSEIGKVDPLLDAFMQVCREKTGALTSAVLLKDGLFDAEVPHYRVKAFHGLDPVYVARDGKPEELTMFNIPQDQGLLWQIIGRGDPFNVLDMQLQPRFTTAFRNWNLSVLQSDVWVPLLVGREVLGVLTLGMRWDRSRIPESDHLFLHRMAQIAAININSAKELERVSTMLRNVEILMDINLALANVNNFKQLVVRTLEDACKAMGAQKANLALLNEDTGELEIKVVAGECIPKHVRDEINEGRKQPRTVAIGEGLAGKSAETGLAQRQNDRSKIPQFGQFTAHCMLSVPLLHGPEKKVVGVMTMTNKVLGKDRAPDDEFGVDPLGRYSPEDEAMALQLANTAAVNLARARNHQKAITDAMTGMWNKRCFEDTIREYVAEGRRFAIAVSDIDKFKRFNDTYGHAAGDYVLIQTAKQMMGHARPATEDGAYRYGGEEFVLLFPDTSAEEAAEIVETYRAAMEFSSFDYEGEKMAVTVSVGVSEFPRDGRSYKEVFELADQALYAAKEGGRNQVRIHQSDGEARRVGAAAK